MKRHFLLLALGMTAAVAGAAVVQPEAALRRALASPQAPASTRGAEFALRSTIQSPSGPALYIFSDAASTVLVSADDQTPALVGYLDAPETAETLHAPEFKYWMNEYARQIEYLRSSGIKASSTSAPDASWAPISPLVKTKWNQDAPYNDLCPMDNGKRSVTGCVATAMSQAINFHQWPVTGTGTHSYTNNGQTLSFDYGDTTFDWANMADTYSSQSTAAQNEAVATLMYACGVAVNMEYTSDESGAISEIIPQVLIKYFNYDKGVRNVIRNVTTQDIWNKTVYDQLAEGRPVIYSGTSNEGGHCFICDGYANGYFHINWGWAGLDDGYFLLSVLNPGDVEGIGGSVGDFAYDQVIVADMKKPEAGSKIAQVLVMPYGFSVAQTSVQPGEQVTASGYVVNYSADAVSGQFGFVAVAEDGKEYYSTEGSAYSSLGVLYETKGFTASIPSGLPDGTYTLRPAYKPQGGEWTLMGVQNGTVSYYDMTVSPSGITLSAQEVPSVTISGISVNSPVFVGKYISVSGQMANTTTLDYSGVAQLMVVDSEGNEVAQGYRQDISLGAGMSQAFSYSSPLSATGSASFDAGEYDAAFVDAETGAQISSAFQIQVQEAPQTQIQVGQLAYSGNAESADKSNLTFTATVECVEGYLAEPLTLLIADSTGAGLEQLDSEPVFIQAGNQQTVTFSGSFPHAVAGETYLACVFYGSQQMGDPIEFTIASSGVDSLKASDTILSMQVFSLDGTKVAESQSGKVDVSQLAPGVYILRAVTPQGVKTIKEAIR